VGGKSYGRVLRDEVDLELSGSASSTPIRRSTRKITKGRFGVKPGEKSFVYTLVLDVEYEGERLLGVYSTIELAKAAGEREAPRHTEWAPVESGGVGTEEDLYCYETEKTVSTILAIAKTEVDKDLTR